MRIIAGKLKGNTLHFPQDKKTRPLKDLARESIFNLLVHSNKMLFQFEKSNILDLYAGSGSFGLECVSRKAENVYFVEKSEIAIKILEKNIQKLKIKEKTKVFCNDVFILIEEVNIFNIKFNLIFCDPPFKSIKTKKLIELINKNKLLHPEGIIIFHRKKNTDEKLPNYFKVIDERIYGISKITFGTILT